ncbi:MAG TPA: tetratricopeptide repeat protein [Steroidobacteraceae bacterium]|nr:tetratricopeptide repeat protein [Steroidobacteraceae bacterium]
MIESNEASFERDVLDASRTVAVLVDFWAPWCAPCRSLGPLLERLEQEYGGRFKLVKVDSDANPGLAARFAVRSIPYVIAFLDGEKSDSFVGALAEGQLRAFIDGAVPSLAERERRRAHGLAASGDSAGAAAAFRAAIALDDGLRAARLDLAELLLERMPPVEPAPLAEAVALLEPLGPPERGDDRQRALGMRLEALQAAAGGAPLVELRARVAAAPDDLRARYDLARRLIAERAYAPALDELIGIIARDRRFDDDAARRLMLSVFELAAGDPQLVSIYRRRLSALLNR